MISNLSLFIKQNAEKFPTDDAIICMHNKRYRHATIREQIGYRDFDTKIDQFAVKFTKLGITKGSRVLMLLKPGIPMITSFFALVRIGAIPVVIDPGMGIKKFATLANCSKIDAIVTSKVIKIAIFLRLIPIKCKLKNIIAITKNFAKHVKTARIAVEMHEEDPVAILFTSGSTGSAKGVVYTHKNFASQFEMLANTYKLQPQERDMTLLPAFMLFNPIFGRTTIIPNINFSKPAKFNAKSVVESITSNAITSSFGSPILWSKIATYCINHKIKLLSIKNIFLAGVSATTEILENITEIAPNAEIFTPYGATESLPVCSISAKEILSDEIRPMQENGAGTCLGKPVDGIDVKIIEAHMKPIEKIEDINELSLGYFGEIIVSGNNVTKMYDQLPEATALAKIYEYKTHIENNYNNNNENSSQNIEKIWHRMGDIGFLDQAGRVWFCGRKVETVIDNDGEEYYPDCIEPLFLKHKNVKRAALITYHRGKQHEPAIVILPHDKKFPESIFAKWKFAKELRNLASQFPKTNKIKKFFFVKKLPVDPRHNSKIHRLALGKKFSKRPIL